MKIDRIFSFLVHPAKALEEQPDIRGARVPLKGNLFRMLKRLFDESEKECSIEISFNPGRDGSQQNDCRDMVISLLKKQDISRARAIAGRLQSVTTNRSGLGLLFIVIGQDGRRTKICISRFPADIGVLAEEQKDSLRIEFIERVFMRNARAYKAAVYVDRSIEAGFWDGKAIDRQINSRVRTISDYWIREFLDSDFRTTSAAGTKRLARALRNAADQADDLAVKEEVSAAARLARTMDGRMTSIDAFADRFLSETGKSALVGSLRQPSLASERFEFSIEEFQKHLPYQSVELNNGAVLIANVDSFDQCFERREIAGSLGETEFKTSGTIVNQRLRKTK